MKATIRLWLLNRITKHLFSGITEKDVVRLNKNGQREYRGIVLDKDMLNVLKTDALAWKNSQLWKILSDDIRYHANLKMFEQSLSTDDLVIGKTALWVIQMMENKIEELAH